MSTFVSLFDERKASFRRALQKDSSPQGVKDLSHNLIDELFRRYTRDNVVTREVQQQLVLLLERLRASLELLLLPVARLEKIKTTHKPLESFDLNQRLPEVLEKPNRRHLWQWVQGGIGLFLFAILWVQNLFFPAFLVAILITIGIVLYFKKESPAFSATNYIDSDAYIAHLVISLKAIDVALEHFNTPTVTNASTQQEKTAQEAVYLSFLQELLEAHYTQDAAYALKKSATIISLLAKLNIQVVDFSEEHRHFFDVLPMIHLPSTNTKQDITPRKKRKEAPTILTEVPHQTLVPALMRHGTVLRRGRVMLDS